MKDVRGEEIPDSRYVYVGWGANVLGVLALVYSIGWPIHMVSSGEQFELYYHEPIMFLGFFLPILGTALVLLKEKTWDLFPTDHGATLKWWQIVSIVAYSTAVVFIEKEIFVYLKSIGYKFTGIQ